MKKTILFSILLISAFSLFGCGKETSTSVVSEKSTAKVSAEPSKEESAACKKGDGKIETEKRGDGKDFFICVIDNKKCETAAFLTKECTGIVPTEYTTPEGKYCAMIGGDYKILEKGTTETGEKGQCTLKNGQFCGAQDLYNGNCDYIRTPVVPVAPTPNETKTPATGTQI